ncbi:hypothetical protein NYR97_05535 [Xanthomonas hydrangeae]|uniref:Lipoprotein n=1 Tax=Xanthomonas hydrangeae TaxID=2775159 RepID=A0AAU0BG28_9XANT|nr:hypothetical protein [Xanthomonas hydrangeae]WOB50852.1 hypothetical protein NYR97_05535 [Xanthomonas hydrangeae]
MRRFISTLPALGLTLLLAACGDKQGVADNTASAPVAPTSNAHSPASMEAAKQGQNDMIKECSGARLHLTALPSKSGDSPKTRVEIERNGERQELAPPAEMVDYTAVGLGCAEDGKGTNYFVIQYGELPYGCEFCEWFFLYDAKGQLLNHAAPPLREQDGQQSPNNDEYEHKLEELGLKHPELVPFQP